MILDEPIDEAKIKRMSEAEKIAFLKQAYGEFMQLTTEAKQFQKSILTKALKGAELKKMNQIRKLIATNFDN